MYHIVDFLSAYLSAMCTKNRIIGINSTNKTPHTQADPAHSLLLIKAMKINGDNELPYLTYQSETKTHIRIIIIIIIIHVMKITVIAYFSYQRSNMSVSHFANSKLN